MLVFGLPQSFLITAAKDLATFLFLVSRQLHPCDNCPPLNYLANPSALSRRFFFSLSFFLRVSQSFLNICAELSAEERRQFNHSKPGLQQAKPFAHKTILNGLTSCNSLEILITLPSNFYGFAPVFNKSQLTLQHLNFFLKNWLLRHIFVRPHGQGLFYVLAVFKGPSVII